MTTPKQAQKYIMSLHAKAIKAAQRNERATPGTMRAAAEYTAFVRAEQEFAAAIARVFDITVFA